MARKHESKVAPNFSREGPNSFSVKEKLFIADPNSAKSEANSFFFF